MAPKYFLANAFLLLVIMNSYSQSEFVPNYDESKIEPYSLPDPLVFEDGTRLTDASQWDQRREEIYRLFEREIYGVAPDWDGGIQPEVLWVNENALDGLAIAQEVKLTLKYKLRETEIFVLFHLPKSNYPVPVFLGYNFFANHTTTPDSMVTLPNSWVSNSDAWGVTDNRATEASRGAMASFWPAKEIVSRGYGLISVYYGDVDPDYDDGFKNGVHGYMNLPHDSTSWGSVAAWAWGLSRVMDYLETFNRIDADKVAVFGHSRLGKAALWAGATDQRFAMVISNQSGCGGAALSRRKYGETVERINTHFPHWFAANYKKYNQNENELPVDQHQLLALIAPRPLYVASAEEDRWADPKGEFLSSLEASSVYEFLGLTGLPVKQMPAVNNPVIHGRIGYHIRDGRHDILLYDWQQYLNFADRHLR